MNIHTGKNPEMICMDSCGIIFKRSSVMSAWRCCEVRLWSV